MVLIRVFFVYICVTFALAAYIRQSIPQEKFQFVLKETLDITGQKPFPPCIPEEGRTALIIGQDYGSILNYTAAFPQHSEPFGFMAYTALTNQYGNLTGLIDPIDYGSGIEWVSGLFKRYSKSSVQLGLWLVGHLEEVVASQLDSQIDQLALYVNSSLPHAFYLRIGYEFDSLENNYDPVLYKLAYQRIVQRIRDLSVTNVAFVWHASGFSPRDDLNYEDWFPGKDYVDFCGVSLFQQPYRTNAGMHFAMSDPDAFAIYCSDLSIPLMVAESTPFGGIIGESQENEENEAGFQGPTWQNWFVPVFSFITRHRVRIWCYINTDWDAQPMWSERHEKGVSWGDSRLERLKDMADLWKEYVLASHRSVLSYDYVSTYNHDIEKVCENIPVNLTAIKDHSQIPPDDNPQNEENIEEIIEEDVIITLTDLVILLLKFLEVVVVMGFIIVCFILITSCCYKIWFRSGYTTI